MLRCTEQSKFGLLADVKAVLGADQVKAIEDRVTAKIAEQKTPTKGSFVPSS